MVKWELVLLFCILTPSCAAIEIIEAHGETWITWEWDYANATTIYVDGKQALNNTSMEFYYLTDISANEEHRIDVYESLNGTLYLLGTDTAKSSRQSWFAYLLIVISVGLVLLATRLTNPIEVLATSLLGLIPSLYVMSNTWTQLGPISFLGMGLAIVAGIWVVKSLWDMYSKKANWW